MKGAQMKMMETFAVMVVFFFLLIIGTSMYSNYQEDQYLEDVRRANTLQSIQISQKAMFLPELKCVADQLLCFDSVKVEQFNKLVRESEEFRQQYFPIFGDSDITIVRIFPLPVTEYKLYSTQADSNTLSVSTSVYPVVIQDPITKKSGFGLLNVTVYQSG